LSWLLWFVIVVVVTVIHGCDLLARWLQQEEMECHGHQIVAPPVELPGAEDVRFMLPRTVLGSLLTPSVGNILFQPRQELNAGMCGGVVTIPRQLGDLNKDIFCGMIETVSKPTVDTVSAPTATVISAKEIQQ
jgi:hypothetical protein